MDLQNYYKNVKHYKTRRQPSKPPSEEDIVEVVDTNESREEEAKQTCEVDGDFQEYTI